MDKFKKIFYFLGIFILTLIIICGNIENGLVFTIISLALIYLFVDKVKIKRFSLFLIIFCLITKIIVILLIDTQIVGDFMSMYSVSKKIATTGLYTNKEPYFNTWGYQLFHVLYQALMLKICNSTIFLKILNCIYSTIITVLIYKITKKLTNEKAARISSLLYSISLYPLYLNTLLGNQQLSLAIALTAIYLLLYKKQTLKYLVIIGILLGFSHLERNEGIVYLLTTIIYIFISNKNINIKQVLKKIGIIVLCFLIITKTASFLAIKIGINEIGFENANKEWKFLLGFNYETNGVYSIKDEKYLIDKTALQKETISRIKNFEKWPKLFYNKIKIQFLYQDFGKSFENTTLEKENIIKTIIFNYTKTINITIILLALLGLIKNKTLKKEKYFFIINFLIFFGVYMLIEICARYYFNPQVTIFILSSFGIEHILKLTEKNKKLSTN